MKCNADPDNTGLAIRYMCVLTLIIVVSSVLLRNVASVHRRY